MDGMIGMDYNQYMSVQPNKKRQSTNNFNTISGGIDQAGSTFKSVEHTELRKETERAIITNLEEQMVRAKEMRNDITQNFNT